MKKVRPPSRTQAKQNGFANLKERAFPTCNQKIYLLVCMVLFSLVILFSFLLIFVIVVLFDGY